MTGALSGIRVIDVTTVISGPVATQILADQGAEVIKIEAPGGDLTRRLVVHGQPVSATFVSSNRNKKSVVLDFKNSSDLDKLYRLVSQADVFVENFRPGTAERIGLGESKLRAVCPTLIYASINGFGGSGPYAHKRVYDPLVQATSGVTALGPSDSTGAPQMVPFVLADKVAALTAAQAITAAIVSRFRTGEGQSVNISMHEALLAFLWPSAMGSLTLPSRDSASPAIPRGSKVFKTADGYITASANSDDEWSGLCKALDEPDWTSDPKFKAPGLRTQHAADLVQKLKEAFSTRVSQDWLTRLDANDVPCAPVLNLEQLLSDKQIIHSGTIVELHHPKWGLVRQPRPAARFSKTPSTVRHLAPELGQDSCEVLERLSTEREI